MRSLGCHRVLFGAGARVHLSIARRYRPRRSNCQCLGRDGWLVSCPQDGPDEPGLTRCRRRLLRRLSLPLGRTLGLASPRTHRLAVVVTGYFAAFAIVRTARQFLLGTDDRSGSLARTRWMGCRARAGGAVSAGLTRREFLSAPWLPPRPPRVGPARHSSRATFSLPGRFGGRALCRGRLLARPRRRHLVAGLQDSASTCAAARCCSSPTWSSTNRPRHQHASARGRRRGRGDAARRRARGGRRRRARPSARYRVPALVDRSARSSAANAFRSSI